MEDIALTQTNLSTEFGNCYWNLDYVLHRIALLTIKDYLEEHPPTEDDPQIFHTWREDLSSPVSPLVIFLRYKDEYFNFNIDKEPGVTDTMRDFLVHMFPRLPHSESESLGVTVTAFEPGDKFPLVTSVDLDSVAEGFALIASYGINTLREYSHGCPFGLTEEQWDQEVLPRMDKFMQGLREDPTFASTDSEGRELFLKHFMGLWD